MTCVACVNRFLITALLAVPVPVLSLVPALHFRVATIRADLARAFGINLVTVPPAMAGLLNPMVAAVAMSASSLLAVGNSLRLRAWHPSRTAPPRPRRG